jgi:nitroreductase
MDLLTGLYTRRAVRAYTDRKVSKDVLIQLTDAAVQAPSALNHQPWVFGVFRDKQRLADYGERARMHFLATFTGGPDPHVRQQEMLHRPGFQIFYGASTLVVIYAKPGGGQFAIGDCCLAAQNFMLAAHALGLGTCPVGFSQPWLDLAEVKSELDVPIHYTAVMPIILGYPVAETPPTGRKKAELISAL